MAERSSTMTQSLGYDNGHYTAWLRWKGTDGERTFSDRRRLAVTIYVTGGETRKRPRVSTSTTLRFRQGGPVTFTLVPEIALARKLSDGRFTDDYYEAKHRHCLGGTGTLEIEFTPAAAR